MSDYIHNRAKLGSDTTRQVQLRSSSFLIPPYILSHAFRDPRDLERQPSVGDRVSYPSQQIGGISRRQPAIHHHRKRPIRRGRPPRLLKRTERLFKGLRAPLPYPKVGLR